MSQVAAKPAAHKGVNSFFVSWNTSATHYSFGPHSRTLFDVQLTS